MNDTLKIAARLSIHPSPSAVSSSGRPSTDVEIVEGFAVVKKLDTMYTLDAAPAVTIGMGDLDGANFIFIYSDESVTVEVTSALGTAQTLPGRIVLLIDPAESVTLIRLTQKNGVTANVRIVLGQLA